MMHRKILEGKLLQFVKEDAGVSDITLHFTPDKKVSAEIIANDTGILAGAHELNTLFELFGVKVKKHSNDGDKIRKGQAVFILTGNSRDILLVKRTALSILSRMSGIATATKQFIDSAKKSNPRVRVAATRKTTPGFRYFEKCAVRVAGGDTHRLTLSEEVLIKKEHLKLFKDLASAIQAAKRQTSFVHKIEVEVDKVENALIAAKEGADIIMLDNMSAGNVQKTIKKLNELGLRKNVILEVSGGITLQNIQTYAKAGPDIISVGEITKNTKAIDFSLNLR